MIHITTTTDTKKWWPRPNLPLRRQMKLQLKLVRKVHKETICSLSEKIVS